MYNETRNFKKLKVQALSVQALDIAKLEFRKFTMLVMPWDLPFHILGLWVSSKSVVERCGWANVSPFLGPEELHPEWAISGQWNRASEDFFESFRNYDEAGSPQRIQVLKYLVLANMLTGSEVNPFDSQETKP